MALVGAAVEAGARDRVQAAGQVRVPVQAVDVRVHALAVLPGPTDTLVLSLAKSAEGAGALFRSVNAGLTWDRVLLGPAGREADEWDAAPCVVRPQEWEDVVFVAAGDALYASHDRARTWTPLADGLPAAHCLAAAL